MGRAGGRSRGRGGSRGRGAGRGGCRGRSLSARAGGGRGGGRSGSLGGAGARGTAGGDLHSRALRGTTSIELENDDVGGDILGGSHHTAKRTASAGELVGSLHLVDTHGRGIDLARQTIALARLTALNLNTELGLLVAEGSSGLQVDRVPANLQEGHTVTVGVGTGGVRRPVTDGVGAGTPDTSLLGGDTGGVDIVLSRGGAPVRHTRDSQGGDLGSQLLDHGRDQHGLVTGQDSLTERDGLAGLVLGRDTTGSILAVRAIGERLLDLAALVTVKTTVLYELSATIPLA